MPLFTNKDILVVAPHQDDDINLMGSVLWDLQQSNARVHVLFTTNGDRFGIGSERQKEAQRALSIFGITTDSIHFLDYRDQYRDISIVHSYHIGDIHAAEVSQILTYLQKIEPFAIFCIDADEHPDHIATSLLLEEALGELLRTGCLTPPPLLYKGFGYDMSYNAPQDYDELLLGGVRKPSFISSPIYNWEDRLRFYPARCCTLPNDKNPVIRALKEYKSQGSINHWRSIINSDKVFWQRNTDNLLYHGSLSSSSGDLSGLLDFRLYDAKNVMARSIEWVPLAWIPSRYDKVRKISISFNIPVDIAQICIVETSNNKSHIENLIIKVDNRSYKVEDIAPTLPGTILNIDATEVKTIELTISSFHGSAPGICLLELLPPREDKLLFIAPAIENEYIQKAMHYKYLSKDIQVYAYYERSGMNLMEPSDYILSQLDDEHKSLLTYQVTPLTQEVSPVVFQINKVSKTVYKLNVFRRHICAIFHDVVYAFDLNFRKVKMVF